MTTPSIFTIAQRGTGVTAWRQIADALGNDIRNRVFAQTGRLPSEPQLAERFGVHRHTVRQAIAELQRQGLVRVEQGRGTFVQHRRLDYPLSRRTRFSEILIDRGLLPSKQLLSARETTPSVVAEKALGLEAGSRVLDIEMLDEADGEPIGLMTACYPAERLAGLLEQLTDGVSGDRTSELLRSFGVADYTRAESRVHTVLASDDQARLLGLAPGRPLLCVESIDIDSDGRPIKYGETLFSGDRVQLVVRPT
jgi:GntR family transcriptional regulator, phosphonate transport system regulatory protein